MQIPLQEPRKSEYLFIDEHSGVLHILVPLIGGNLMGTDNTCSSLLALQRFLGQKKPNPHTGATVFHGGIEKALYDYEAALKFDLEHLDPESPLYDIKSGRMKEFEAYFDLLFGDANLFVEIANAAHGTWTTYPDFILKYIADHPQNLCSIRLSPKEEDPILRAAHPLFSVSRDPENPGFAQCLRDHLLDIETMPEDPTEEEAPGDALYQEILEATMRKLRDRKPQNLQDIINALSDYPIVQTEKALKGYEGTAQETHQAYLEDLGFEEKHFNDETEVEALVDGFLQANSEFITPEKVTLPDEQKTLFFYTPKENEDDAITNMRERMSILTQFMLAIINVYCHQEGLSEENFGNVLDSTPDLQGLLASTLVRAFKEKRIIEDVIFEVINDSFEAFGLSRKLTPEDHEKITRDFHTRFLLIDGSPHYDEFYMFYPERQGAFKTFHGFIAMDLAHLAQSNPEITLPPALRHVAERAIGLPAELPATNEHLPETIEVDEAKFQQKYNFPLKLFAQFRPDLQQDIELLRFLVNKLGMSVEAIEKWETEYLYKAKNEYNKLLKPQKALLKSVKNNPAVNVLFIVCLGHHPHFERLITNETALVTLSRLDVNPFHQQFPYNTFEEILNLLTQSPSEEELSLLIQFIRYLTLNKTGSNLDRFDKVIRIIGEWDKLRDLFLDPNHRIVVEQALHSALWPTKAMGLCSLLNINFYQRYHDDIVFITNAGREKGIFHSLRKLSV